MFSNSVKDESDSFKIPSILQDEKPKSETVKASERVCDGATKRRTLALDERRNDLKKLCQERRVRKNILYSFFKLN